MKKYQSLLFKVAEYFQVKYAAQDLQEIIFNAASYGEQSTNGIMNFPAQLKQENADMTINVTISGKDIDVGTPNVNPPQFAGNYARLPDQIKAYLERHWRDFPLPQGTTTLTYTGSSGIAKG